jgi:O-methyltransferase
MNEMLLLNLPEASLTGTLYKHPPQDPWARNAYNPTLRALGRDWPALAQTMIGSAQMRNLHGACETVIRDEVPGDFIETGGETYSGYCRSNPQ